MERIRLDKQTVTEHETVTEGLRKEEVEVDGVAVTTMGTDRHRRV